MQPPFIKYLVSSPYGDVPVDKDKYDFPLEGDTLKTPYRVYFDAIETFLFHEAMKPLINAVTETHKKETTVKEIQEIIIRAEKHGALSHPASIELILKDGQVKFGLNVAVTDTGKESLKREFIVLRTLHEKFNLPYIPKPYFVYEFNSMVFLLEEWFEGYHEFHLSMTEGGEQLIKLWEFGKGYQYLSYEQSFEIYRQASKILTLYYDMNDFCQIYPWHHAAGDFIARIEDDKIDVRLTTVRQYEPYIVFQEKEHINPVIALFFFLLNLTIKMRLDKLDGVGNTVWAGDFCLEASVKGFLDGVRLKKEFKNYFSSENDFFKILKSFRLEDLKTSYNPLIDLYNGTGDHPVITAKLDKHVEALYTILQNSPS